MSDGAAHLSHRRRALGRCARRPADGGLEGAHRRRGALRRHRRRANDGAGPRRAACRIARARRSWAWPRCCRARARILRRVARDRRRHPPPSARPRSSPSTARASPGASRSALRRARRDACRSSITSRRWCGRGAPGRARRMARWYDHLMALLPFEPPYFDAVGLVLRLCRPSGGRERRRSAATARRSAAATASRPTRQLLIAAAGQPARRGRAGCCRSSRDAVALLAARYPELARRVPTTETVAARVERRRSRAGRCRCIVLRGAAEKYDAFAASDVALAASGTVALELALARAAGGRRLSHQPVDPRLMSGASSRSTTPISSTCAEREAVPELLQDDCTPERLAAAVAQLLDDEAARARANRGLPGGAAGARLWRRVAERARRRRGAGGIARERHREEASMDTATATERRRLDARVRACCTP